MPAVLFRFVTGFWLVAAFPLLTHAQANIDSIPGLLASFSADATNAADGTAMTTWADLSGNNNHLVLPATGGAFTAPLYASNALGGLPALWFNSPSNLLVISNLYLNHKDLASNMTLVFVGQNYHPTNENFLLGWWLPGNPTPFMKVDAYDIVQVRGGAGAVNVFPDGSFGFAPCGVPLLGTNVPFCHLFTYGQDDARAIVFDRGKFSNCIGKSGKLFLANHLILGNCGELIASGFFRGYLAELRLYNRKLTRAEIALVSTVLSQKYGLLNPQREITLDGDSEMWGTAATTNKGPSCLVHAALGAKWQVNNVAQGGRIASERVQNLTNWSAGSSDSVVACLLGPSDILGLITATNTQLNISNYCRAVINRGQRVIVGTVPSLWPAGNPNASGLESNRVALDEWIRGNWRSFANGLADYAADDRIGGWGAATNQLYFYTDGIHPNGNAYELMMPALVSMINSNAPTLAEWRQQYFATTNNLGDAADAADPDLDGWSNFQEFAFHLDPKIPEVSPLQSSTTADGHLAVTFQRIHPPPPELIYGYYVADDPVDGTWQSGPAFIQETVTDNEDGTETVTITDVTAFSDQAKHFLKVMVGQ